MVMRTKEFYIGVVIGLILVALICVVVATVSAKIADDRETTSVTEDTIFEPTIIRNCLDDGNNIQEVCFGITEEVTEEETDYLSYPPTETETAPVEEEWKPEERDVVAMAKLLWGECRGVKSKAEQAAVAWCVLNRFDNPRFGGDTIYDVITAKYQFAGYNKNNPVTEELKELAEDVLNRWHREQMGEKPVGRTLPKDYVYFVGKNGHNWFSIKWKSGEYFDFAKLATNPYDN